MDGTALIVGGSSAIGSAIGQSMAGLGLDVVLWGRSPDRLAQSVEAVTSAGAAAGTAGGGAAARSEVVDVTDRSALTAAAAGVCRGPLRVVVWAGGVFDWAPADEARPEAWESVFDVNLTSAALATRLLLPQLVDGAPSALVYIGSGASRQAFAGNAAYVASKHGLLGLSQAVWLDVRDRGVKVSLVSPGLVAAGAGLGAPVALEHPDRLLTPADVAAAVTFVVTFPGRGCPTEIRLETQRTT